MVDGRRCLRHGAVAMAAVFGLLVAGGLLRAQQRKGPERWEKSIAAFERQDRESPPPENAVLFIGSSSIRRWDLTESFPNLEAINRGFGGSQIADSTHFAERIVIPYKPRLIVLYAGDNDIAAGKSPEQVFADFKAFVHKVMSGLPDTHIVFVAIKPSIRRWSLYGKMKEANRLIRDLAEKDPKLEYVEVAKAMLGEDGRPRKELFVDDGLHLNKRGYKLWSGLVRPHLAQRQ
jgi:lysophospholipase L1-like esterase